MCLYVRFLAKEGSSRVGRFTKAGESVRGFWKVGLEVKNVVRSKENVEPWEDVV